jgi:hypothetical protein
LKEINDMTWVNDVFIKTVAKRVRGFYGRVELLLRLGRVVRPLVRLVPLVTICMIGLLALR